MWGGTLSGYQRLGSVLFQTQTFQFLFYFFMVVVADIRIDSYAQLTDTFMLREGERP